MHPKVHAAALRAAAKVAFSVAFLGGCAASVELGESDETKAPSADPALPVPEASSSAAEQARIHPPPLPASSGHVHPVYGGPDDCKALVDEAFPTDGDYPGTKQDLPLAVQDCCAEILATQPNEGHRWDCCANLPPDATLPMACTPWGPPVPPRMRARTTTTFDLQEVA